MKRDGGKQKAEDRKKWVQRTPWWWKECMDCGHEFRKEPMMTRMYFYSSFHGPYGWESRWKCMACYGEPTTTVWEGDL